MDDTAYDLIDEFVAEKNFDEITHMILNATDSILTDPHKLEYIIKKCVPERENFKSWDRIIGIVERYFVSIGHDHAYRMQFFYIEKPKQP